MADFWEQGLSSDHLAAARITGIDGSSEREVRRSGSGLGRESSKQERDLRTWRGTINVGESWEGVGRGS